MPPAFQYVTWLQLQQELALRLNDTANVRWTVAENKLYLTEALRVWNCLSQQGVDDWSITYTQPAVPNLPIWQSTGNGVNPNVGSNMSSPRFQTLNTSDVFTLIQYHLLEPPTGFGTWTGTKQFSLADFGNTFMRRRDLILQMADCNVGPFTVMGILPGTNRIQLPDSTALTILDMRRVRFIPSPGLGNPSTLYRDDLIAFEYFDNGFEQERGTPLCWDVLGSPLQYVTFDQRSNIPASLDCLGVISGAVVPTSAPVLFPYSAPLLIPDDYMWVLKFGMMADLLSKETESKDLLRAQYCQQRFTEGVRLMMELPWLTQAYINGVPVDTPSFFEADQYDYEWQSNPSAMTQIIRGGIDLFAISPIIPPSTTVGIVLTLIGNAKIPALDTDYVQIPREVVVAILDEAEHLAQFKEGGQEMMESIELHKRFVNLALETNRRLKESGIFYSDIRRDISKEDEAQPRFALEGKEQ